MARIAVVGSRKLPRDRARAIIFNGIAGTAVDDVIVSGGARGPQGARTTVSADREAARAAAFYRRAFDEFPADWDGLGKGAGFVRNGFIVASLSGPEDRLVALHDGSSPGTKHVAELARRWGKLKRLILLRRSEQVG